MPLPSPPRSALVGPSRGDDGGRNLPLAHRSVFLRGLGIRRVLRATLGRWLVTVLDWIAGIIAALLLVYLLVAMLTPERLQ